MSLIEMSWRDAAERDTICINSNATTDEDNFINQSLPWTGGLSTASSRMKCLTRRNSQEGGSPSLCVGSLRTRPFRNQFLGEERENRRDQQGDEPHQEREDKFGPGILQAGRQIMEPGELHQRLIDPAQAVVILKEFGNINLGHETEPDQTQSDRARHSSKTGAGPLQRAHEEMASAWLGLFGQSQPLQRLAFGLGWLRRPHPAGLNQSENP